MIIIGYQGIGKTTLCNNPNTLLKYIDLESSSFFNDDGLRPENWYVYYCNVAEHLSKQGYSVFVSSHKVVRERLAKSKEKVICVFPSQKIKDDWIKRLENRYNSSKSDKDYRAWQNALSVFDSNISDLKSDVFPCIEINTMNYDLRDLIIGYEINTISSDIKEEMINNNISAEGN